MDNYGFTRLDAERKAPVLYARSIDSTNNALKKLAAQSAPDGTVLWASEQTAGRGRLGRSFLSPEGGLYLSMLWRPDCPPEKTVSLTSAPPSRCAAVLRLGRRLMCPSSGRTMCSSADASSAAF